MKTSPKSQKKRAIFSSLVTALLVMILFFGIGIMLYPSLADFYNRTHASQTIQDYNREVELKSREERQQLWDAADAYNASLAARTILGGGTIDTTYITAEQDAEYYATLDVNGEGLIGYVSAPEADIYLPIGHGTSEKVLQMEAGHLEGSSLPVGGASTHCVLTGHTGLSSARLFTNLDRLKEGDTFQVIVLNRTLTYEVFRIQVVLPTSVDSLRIEEGQDLCTLLTCTPYGINDHRLLVTGRRIANPENADDAKSQDVQEKAVRRDLMPAVIAVIGAVTFIILYKKIGGKKRNRA